MFKNLLKRNKPVVLGRWSTGTSTDIIERRIAMAHCDNCGSCKVPEPPPHIIQPMAVVDDDVVYFGYAPGSFDLYSVK